MLSTMFLVMLTLYDGRPVSAMILCIQMFLISSTVILLRAVIPCWASFSWCFWAAFILRRAVVKHSLLSHKSRRSLISSLHIDITEAEFAVGYNRRNGNCYDGLVCMSRGPAVVVTRPLSLGLALSCDEYSLWRQSCWHDPPGQWTLCTWYEIVSVWASNIHLNL